MGLWRHTLLRPVGVLRSRRLHVCDRRHQYGRQHGAVHARYRVACGLCGGARLSDLLWAAFGRVHGRDHAHCHTDSLQPGQLDGRTGMEDRQCGARRLQRYSQHRAAQYARQYRRCDQSARTVRAVAGGAARRLFFAARAARVQDGAGNRREQGERTASAAARLRLTRLQAVDLRAGRGHRRAVRLPLRELGRV